MELSITEPEQANNIKSILKTNSNIKNTKQPKRVSYDDILAKMGMYVDNGKLHLDKNNNCSSTTSNFSQCTKVKCSRVQESLKQQQHVPRLEPQNQQNLQNSYIYNKHFKNHINPEPVKQFIPSTPEEYRQMALQKIIQSRIQRIRVNQIKSTKLIMATNNINIATNPQTNLNRLFHFSQR
jgi:hypothetical protein